MALLPLNTGAGAMNVTFTQKFILIALLVLGVLCLVVGFSLMHYIGGFLRTVEEEAREQESEEQGADAAKDGERADSPKEE